jgi:hypothetical protein
MPGEYSMIKDRVKSFLSWNIVDPIVHNLKEIVYQNIFNNQCLNAGISNDFYPVGDAANYSLLYLVFRILKENELETIIELGSGQTTLLIDRIKRTTTNHICYEDDHHWFKLLEPKLQNTDYRYTELSNYIIDDISCDWYAHVEYEDFDFLLIDGPRGVERFSRLGCCELISRSTGGEFIIVFDDSERRGEQDTIAHVCGILNRKGSKFKISQLRGNKEQTIISTGRYSSVRYF